MRRFNPQIFDSCSASRLTALAAEGFEQDTDEVSYPGSQAAQNEKHTRAELCACDTADDGKYGDDAVQAAVDHIADELRG